MSTFDVITFPSPVW